MDKTQIERINEVAELAKSFLAELELLKTVIFVTEDGVKYYNDKDWVWDVQDVSCNYSGKYPYFLSKTQVSIAKIAKNNTKYFSTEKAAKNYIKCNLKCLSFNDVWNLSLNKSSDNNYVVIGKSDLQKLVKERMPKL